MTKVRLSNEEWNNIFKNIQNGLDDGLESEYGATWVEVLWLDSTDEWVLGFDTECFEDGFKSEKEAYDRLYQLERELL